MNRKNPLPRFDVATLKDIAGPKVFERGIAYERQDRVEIVSFTAGRVVAKVKGTEPYRVDLSGGASEFSGVCTCMAFQDFGFCKHMVATALRANALGPDAAGEFEKRAGRVENHLVKQGANALAAMIMRWAEGNETMMREIEFLAAVAEGDDDTLFRQGKAAIDAATHVHGFVEYDAAGSWADAVREEIDRIALLVEKGRANLALRLLEHSFEEIDEALGNIDDSNGEGGAVYAHACEIHLASCKAAKPEPVGLARFLFGWETESDWDYFLDASLTYEDVLGEKGLAEYRRLAAIAWQTLSAKNPRASGYAGENSSYRSAITRMMERFALRDGDVDAVIAIRTKDLSSAFGYLEIAKLCLEHGRDAEALKWVSEGIWQFEDNPDSRLTRFAIDLYRKTGRPEEAVKLGWQMFEKRPDIDGYLLLKGLDEKGADGEVRDRAIALLKTRIASDSLRSFGDGPADLAIAILTAEGLTADAWPLAKAHGCSQATLRALAQASEKSQPHEALAAYATMISELVETGGSHNYDEAYALIKRMKAIREGAREQATHAAYVADLSLRYKAKRNFMKLINAGK